MSHARYYPVVNPLEITPQQVKQRLDEGAAIRLIDVREPQEVQLASISGSDVIPMRTIPATINQLEDQADENLLIVFCHHGIRSLQVVNWLQEQGVSHCVSMAGGIDRWSIDVDPAIPRY